MRYREGGANPSFKRAGGSKGGGGLWEHIDCPIMRLICCWNSSSIMVGSVRRRACWSPSLLEEMVISSSKEPMAVEVEGS